MRHCSSIPLLSDRDVCYQLHWSHHGGLRHKVKASTCSTPFEFFLLHDKSIDHGLYIWRHSATCISLHDFRHSYLGTCVSMNICSLCSFFKKLNYTTCIFKYFIQSQNTRLSVQMCFFFSSYFSLKNCISGECLLCSKYCCSKLIKSLFVHVRSKFDMKFWQSICNLLKVGQK